MIHEKAATKLLCAFLHNSLLEEFKSRFSVHHSTESADSGGWGTEKLRSSKSTLLPSKITKKYELPFEKPTKVKVNKDSG